MLALSWKQPYASMMLHNKIETRSRKTNIRGEVLICASKHGYSGMSVLSISTREQLEQMIKLVGDLDELPCGVAIAVGELYDCQPMLPFDEAQAFVQYYPGLWSWFFRNVRAIEPIPFKGKQGWTKLSNDFISKIKYL